MTETQITYTIRRPTTNPTARAAMRQAARLAERIAALTEQRDDLRATADMFMGEILEWAELAERWADRCLLLAAQNREQRDALRTARAEVERLQVLLNDLGVERGKEVREDTHEQPPADPLGDLTRLGNLVYLP